MNQGVPGTRSRLAKALFRRTLSLDEGRMWSRADTMPADANARRNSVHVRALRSEATPTKLQNSLSVQLDSAVTAA